MIPEPPVPSLFSVKDNVILITGGYGLLGRQFATTLAAAGASVVIGGKDSEKVRQFADEIGAYGVKLDVTDKHTVKQSVLEIMRKYGRIDGLINNASFSSPADEKSDNFTSVEAVSDAKWNHSLQVDLSGVFFCSQVVGKVMGEQRGGVIVNVSSVYGIGAPDPEIYDSVRNEDGDTYVKSIGYCAAKSGVLNLTRYLAVYWRDKNIRVNAMTLGGVHDSQPEAFVNAYAYKTPMGRMATPDEYNGAVLFLLSDASSYMTGANLIIDGGWSAW